MSKELIAYLKSHIEPIERGPRGARYAASAELTDGLVLPRVMFVPASVVDNMVYWLIEESGEREKLRNTLGHFVDRTRIEARHIRKIQPSPYACPARIYDALSDPVERMEFAEFSLEMDDGKKLYFDLHKDEEFDGPPEFLTLPREYTFESVVKAHAAERAPKGEHVIVYGTEPVFYCLLGEEG